MAGTGLLKQIRVTPVMDTSEYVTGDVLWTASVELANVFAARGAASNRERSNVAINSVSAYQLSGVVFDWDLVFMRSNVSLGTVNDAVTITDADMQEIVGFANITIANADDLPLINSTFYAREGLAIQVQGLAGDDRLFIAGISRGTVTFAQATDFIVSVGITQD